MCLTRRHVVVALGAFAAPVLAHAEKPFAGRKMFDEAFRMRDIAIQSGDQPYGAVVVLDDQIVGYGPSRVVLDSDQNAHAERVAIRDAQMRLGRERLDGAILVSTSRPCGICQPVAHGVGIARMYFGREGRDGGAPAR
jgi:tRNA(Arg) A34 adenosine deaminase TadA